MKRYLPLFSVLCLAIPCSVHADEKTEAVAVRQVAKDYETLWNKHDMDAFANLFTDDVEWVNVVGMVWRGKPDMKKAHQIFHETNFKGRSIQLDDVTVRFVRPDVAVAIAKWNTDAFDAPDGRHFDKAKNVSMLVLAKQNGKWLISGGENVTVDPLAAAFDPIKK